MVNKLCAHSHCLLFDVRQPTLSRLRCLPRKCLSDIYFAPICSIYAQLCKLMEYVYHFADVTQCFSRLSVACWPSKQWSLHWLCTSNCLFTIIWLTFSGYQSALCVCSIYAYNFCTKTCFPCQLIFVVHCFFILYRLLIKLKNWQYREKFIFTVSEQCFAFDTNICQCYIHKNCCFSKSNNNILQNYFDAMILAVLCLLLLNLFIYAAGKMEWKRCTQFSIITRKLDKVNIMYFVNVCYYNVYV